MPFPALSLSCKFCGMTFVSLIILITAVVMSSHKTWSGFVIEMADATVIWFLSKDTFGLCLILSALVFLTSYAECILSIYKGFLVTREEIGTLDFWTSKPPFWFLSVKCALLKKILFIWLLVLVAACEIFGLHHGIWDLVCWPGIKVRPSELGAQSEPLDHQGSPCKMCSW